MLHKATVLYETISSDICGEVNELQTLRTEVSKVDLFSLLHRAFHNVLRDYKNLL
jgi:hypothetical protein